MEKTIEIPEGYEARIEGNKVILEPIREEIIEYFKHYSGGDNISVKFPRWITYLERQKEQKPAEIDEYEIIKKHITEDALSSEVNKRLKECGWYIADEKPAEWNEDIIRKAIEEVGLTQHQINWFKNNIFPPKQEWNEEDKKILNAIIGVLKEIKSQPLKRMEDWDGYIRFLKSLHPQPKQEWSEEDKEMLFFLNEFMDNKGKDYFSTLVYPKIKIWLKTLPERFNLQPKQEWSETDKQMLENIIEVIGEMCPGNYTASFITKMLSWLKSLHPHPHWKPSEEQMLALGGVLDYLEESDNEDADIVRELINDLKKL